MKPFVSVKIGPALADWWQVTVGVADGRFRPAEGCEWQMSREGRLLFCGPEAEREARDAFEQLSFALRPLAHVIPIDDVDSLLAGIARQVGAEQLASGPNVNFSGVVRSYLRDGAWKTMHQRTAIAEERAARLEDDNRSLRARVAELERRANKRALRIAQRERVIWKAHGDAAEGMAGATACDNIIAELEAAEA